MNMIIIERNGKKIVAASIDKILIASVQDALDFIGFCGNNRAMGVLLDSNNLSPDFFDLKTRLAGEVLQKFINYRVRFAVVIPDHRIGNGRFSEMVSEANRGGDFRVFQDKEKAIDWLVSD
jgi:PadR family transcriptional regulator, regulatory protein AphA